MDWHKHLEEVAILNRRIAALESQLAELRQGGEAIVWIASDDLRQLRENPGKREVIAVFARKECSVGPTSPLYTRPHPAIPPGYVVVAKDSLHLWKELALLNPKDLPHRIDAWLASAPSVPVAEKWQPIETAPKDGATILALECWIYHTDARLRPHYVLHEVFFNDDGDWEIVEDGEILDNDSLTHWLPRNRIPAAPADSKEGEK